MDRGFSVSAIRELLEALKNGVGLDEFLGVEKALTSPWSEEAPQFISFKQLHDMFPDIRASRAFFKAQSLGVFTLEGAGVRVSSLKLLEVAVMLTNNGLPLEQLLNILERTQANVQLVANDFIKLVATHALEPYGENNLPPREDLPDLTELIWELRPLAEKAVNVELGKAMGEAANEFLAEKLSAILSQMSDE